MSGRGPAAARGADRVLRPGAALAAVRVAAIPVFFLAERLVNHPATNSAPFDALLALAALYALATAVTELRGGSLAPAPVLAAADLVVIGTLVATSGGPFSQLRLAFFLLPVGAALMLRPALTAAASAVAVATYAVIVLTYPETSEQRPDAAGFELTQALFLALVGTAATLISALLARRAREVGELAASRRRLVAQALDAEDVARRRLAEGLHDNALQNLLAARQLVGSGDPTELQLATEGLDEGVRQIREAVFDLHPYLLEQAGLGAALQAVVEQIEERGGPAGRVEVDAGAEGIHDQLVFSVAREALANVVKHAAAEHVEVRVGRGATAIRLEVADDGVGLDADRARGAPLRGHIGLASCRERAAAIGGTFAAVPRAGGRGTVVRMELPAPARG
ncbi:MAG TPA: ATP-binding protein [Baekduia sp.]|nr:ATP-binding protein [Baekduia sp.]